MKDRVRTVYWHNDPVDVTLDEWIELSKLATDDPVKANEKAKEYWLRQQNGE